MESIKRYFASMERDEKDAFLLSCVFHTLIVILGVYAGNLAVSRDLTRKVEDTVVVINLDNVKIAKEDNVPNFAQSVVAEKPVEQPVEEPKAEEKQPEKPLSVPKIEETVMEKPVEGATLEAEKSKPIEKKVEKKPKVSPVVPVEKKSGSLDDLFKSVDDIKKAPTAKPLVNNGLSVGVSSDKAPDAFSKNSTSTSGEITISYINAIKTKIKGCWNVDPGALGMRDMIIVLNVALSPAGAVQNIVIDDMNSYNSSPSFRAATDSARRALIDCGPYNLPMDKYDQWKDIEFTFDPGKNLVK